MRDYEPPGPAVSGQHSGAQGDFRFQADQKEALAMLPCVLWPGSIGGKGYGWTRDGEQAHRAVFAMIHGYYPPVVRHACDNPPCIEPTHLLAGTQADNLQDMRDRGREAHQRGEENGRSVLTEIDVRAIRERLAAGTSTYLLAAAYGVGRTTIRKIRDGQMWSHVLTG